MKPYEPDNLLLLGAQREGLEIYKQYTETADWREPKPKKQYVVGVAIMDGKTPGVLIQQPNVQHTDKGPLIYYLYTDAGPMELDVTAAESAIHDFNKKENTNRRRSVTMTDADNNYLSKLGGGNVSAGIRVAVEAVRRSGGGLNIDHLTFKI